MGSFTFCIFFSVPLLRLLHFLYRLFPSLRSNEGKLMTLQIDKNVPLPPRAGGSELDAFTVGDSTFFPGKSIDVISAKGRVHAQRRADGRKYTARTVTENGVSGVRLWRVA